VKIAISIPDRLFRDADKLARKLRVPRSVLYARALAAYVQSHEPRDVTERLDAAYRREDSRLPEDVADLQRASLVREEEEGW
jgi:metal-responsive CopG/Arc/MetJ family transcriptional regulator